MKAHLETAYRTALARCNVSAETGTALFAKCGNSCRWLCLLQLSELPKTRYKLGRRSRGEPGSRASDANAEGAGCDLVTGHGMEPWTYSDGK